MFGSRQRLSAVVCCQYSKKLQQAAMHRRFVSAQEGSREVRHLGVQELLNKGLLGSRRCHC